MGQLEKKDLNLHSDKKTLTTSLSTKLDTLLLQLSQQLLGYQHSWGKLRICNGSEINMQTKLFLKGIKIKLLNKNFRLWDSLYRKLKSL